MKIKRCPITKRLIDCDHPFLGDCAVDCAYFDEVVGKCPVDKYKVSWSDSDD